MLRNEIATLHRVKQHLKLVRHKAHFATGLSECKHFEKSCHHVWQLRLKNKFAAAGTDGTGRRNAPMPTSTVGEITVASVGNATSPNARGVTLVKRRKWQLDFLFLRP